MNRIRAAWRALRGLGQPPTSCPHCAARDEIIRHLHGELDFTRSQVSGLLAREGAVLTGPPPSSAPEPALPKPIPSRHRHMRVPWSQSLLANGHVNQEAVRRRIEAEVREVEKEAGMGPTPAAYDEGNG